jgi:chromosome transmission fidelity protein 8
MVQICISVKDPSSQVPEWVLLELQGDLESKQNLHLAGSFVGDLHYTKDGIPVLIIGHHILYGKVEELTKPLVAMKKMTNVNRVTDKNDEHIEVSGTSIPDSNQSIFPTPISVDNSCNTSYIVHAVIKRKLLFKSRPKPIIANVPKKV